MDLHLTLFLAVLQVMNLSAIYLNVSFVQNQTSRDVHQEVP